MFITLEGPEGAGKTTLITGLADWLKGQGREVLVTREPGAGEVGAAIRRIILEGGEIDPKCEMFLFLADRAQHVATEIRPALDQGLVVLCDRFADSTVVYQGYGRGMEISSLREWNRLASNGIRPHVTLLLDIPPEVGLARVSRPDRIDREPLAFHLRVREGFLKEARQEPDRWRIIDAGQTSERVLQQAIQLLQDQLLSRHDLTTGA